MRYVPKIGINKICEPKVILESIYLTFHPTDNDTKLVLEISKIELDPVFFPTQ